jgi:hypothetical protein
MEDTTTTTANVLPTRRTTWLHAGKRAFCLIDRDYMGDKVDTAQKPSKEQEEENHIDTLDLPAPAPAPTTFLAELYNTTAAELK